VLCIFCLVMYVCSEKTNKTDDKNKEEEQQQR
jgi:hypothetical protein